MATEVLRFASGQKCAHLYSSVGVAYVNGLQEISVDIFTFVIWCDSTNRLACLRNPSSFSTSLVSIRNALNEFRYSLWTRVYRRCEIVQLPVPIVPALDSSLIDLMADERLIAAVYNAKQLHFSQSARVTSLATRVFTWLLFFDKPTLIVSAEC